MIYANQDSNLVVGNMECWKNLEHRETPFRLGEDQSAIFFQTTKRELHGLGEIISVPFCQLKNEKAHKKKTGADILYVKKFTPPISVPNSIPKLRWDNRSLPLVLTEGFQGTCFSITENDWGNLKQICPQLEGEILQ
jgi:hypothetical protein